MNTKHDPSIFTIEGQHVGPTITITAGVHGNEIGGILAVLRILSMIKTKQLTIKSGRVHFIFANLAAIGQGKRQTDMNLNRAFRLEETYTAKERSTYERLRALQIMPYLRKSHALLDLHSSMNTESTPFIICEPHSYHIAAKLPVEIVSRGWDVIEAGGTDYFVNQNPDGQNYGICIECGYHNDPKAPERAFQAAMIFLAEFGCIEAQTGFVPYSNKQRYIWANKIYHTKVNFKLVQHFADFQPITKGTLVGFDGDDEVCATQDSVIIFPQDCNGPNDEAFILGIEE